MPAVREKDGSYCMEDGEVMELAPANGKEEDAAELCAGGAASGKSGCGR